MGTVVMLSSVEYVRRNLDHPGEYYAIIAFTIVGMMLLASSGELLTAYISLELLSFGLYVLVSLDRYNPKSNEGGTKYILLGALSSALLLFGMSQIFGLLGTTRFDGIARGAGLYRRNRARGRGRAGADHRRTGIQGSRRAVPHVGAGRV